MEIIIFLLICLLLTLILIFKELKSINTYLRNQFNHTLNKIDDFLRLDDISNINKKIDEINKKIK